MVQNPPKSQETKIRATTLWLAREAFSQERLWLANACVNAYLLTCNYLHACVRLLGSTCTRASPGWQPTRFLL